MEKKSIWDVVQQFIKVFPSPEGNLKVIVLCVIAATTFWFFSALNKSDYSTKIEYPITFTYDADSTVVLSELPENIIVDVTGGGWNLLRKTFSINSPPMEIPLEDPTNTSYILGRNLAQDVSERLQGDLRLNYVVTDTIFIDIEKKAQKEIIIAIDSAQLDLAGNYRITSPIAVVPKTAVMVGPESHINAASDTLMIQIPEEEISEDYDETLQLEYEGSQYINLTPNQTEVYFEVDPFTLLTQEVQPTLINFPEDSSLTLAQDVVSISFWMPEDLLEADDSLHFEVVADLEKMNNPDSTIAPELVAYPPYATDILLLPTQLKVIRAQSE